MIEDAYPTERYAFELQLAPLRLERAKGGVYQWGVEPEVAYGILPRTQLEVGLPILYREAPGDARGHGAGSGGEFGLAGLEASLLHNLNTETRTLPAFAIAADLRVPMGSFGPDRAYAGVKGLATRTFTFARVHANAQYTFGAEPDQHEQGAEEVSRWLAGVAVDHTFPIRSLLLIGDLYARQPIHADDDLEVNVEAGLRYQLAPQFNLDVGLGRTISGDPETFLTLGAAYAFGIRTLIPVPSRRSPVGTGAAGH